MLKIKFLLSIIIFQTIHINAQNMSCNEKVETEFINKVKNYNSKDLIPYFSENENKWGYFDRNTKKIITKPIMKEPYFFHPSIEFYYSFETEGSENGCNGEISGSKNAYKIKSLQDETYQVFGAMYSGNSKAKKNYANMISDDIKGFEVDSLGNLSKFNSKFYNTQNGSPSINYIIFFKNKYYAISKITENDKNFYSIINQDGKTFTNFDKLEFYPIQKQIYSDDDDLWFICKTDNEKYIYKSLLNNEQLKDSLDDFRIYGNRQDQSLGYVIYSVNQQKGLLDLTTMKWEINPSSKNDFVYLDYATSDPLLYSYKKDKASDRSDAIISNKDIEENRKNSYIYIQTSKNNFYDLNLKLYSPKKN